MPALRMRGSTSRAALFGITAALLVACTGLPAAASEAIAVRLDEATVLNLPQRATTVVIGNPLIADISVQSGSLAVVTAKAYGTTNIIVMDKAGAVLLEKTIVVKEPSDPVVVVYRGATRETYSCTPLCSPRIMLGDDPDYFVKVLNETATRNTQAMAGGIGH